MDSSKDDAIARRRAQNRIAQRRFRWKQSQQKSATAEQPDSQSNGGCPVELDPPSEQAPVPTGPEAVSPPGFLSFLDTDTKVSSPTNPCRFSLLGNAALLAAGFWSNDDPSTANADFAMTSALSSPQPSGEVSTEPTRQNPDTAPRPTYVRSSSGEILPHADSIFPTALQRSRVSSGEIPCLPPLNPILGMEPTCPLDMEAGQPRRPSAQNTSISPGDSGISVGGNSTGENSWLGPLHIAAQKGHDRIVHVLLQHDMDCNEKDSDGMTPLYYAIKGGFEGIATSLVEHGARIDQVDSYQRNALHWAVLEKREGILRLLLDHAEGNEALINSYDGVGMTPLHTAVDTGFEAGVQVLLQYGANLNYRARKI